MPTHYTRRTMGPRVREDDEIRDRKRLIDRSYKEEVGITKMRQDKPTAPLSHKHSAHRRHTTSRHSRAHGKPFVHTRRMSRLEMHLPQQPLKQANSSNFNTAIAINHSIRSTMGPRVREDDEKKTKRKSRQTEVRKKKVRRVKDERKHQQRHYPVKTQHISAAPPAVIPVHTGIHLSAHARCCV